MKRKDIFNALAIVAVLIGAALAMGALSADRATIRKDGDLATYPVYQSVTIYNGALVSINSSGYAIPAADTASTTFAGVATAQADNSSGSSGAINVTVRRKGVFKFPATSITQAHVNGIMYLKDDQTFDNTSSNLIACGRLIKYESSTLGWIEIDSAVITPAAIAASAVSVADSGTLYTATNAEDAFAEVKAIADANKVDLTTTQAFISIPLSILREWTTGAIPNIAANGGLLASDSTPVLQTRNADTDGALRVLWAASNSDAVGFQTALPPDMDGTAAMVIHIYAAWDGSTDITAAITSDCYFGVADTKVEDGVTLSEGTTLTEYTITVAASDVPDTANFTVSCELTPDAHTTNILYVYGLWIEYTRKQLTQ
ncbi:MAG: hypothetical protein WC551_11385 [Patescibacteria group bacterium]